MDKNSVKKIILYLINRLGDGIEGKKKLMKLMFLVNHYDPKSGELSRDGFLGLDFSIYYYGVFSREVMMIVEDSIQKKDVYNGFPLRSRYVINLDGNIKNRVDFVIDKFGKKSGYLLEIETLKMLGYSPDEKDKIFGKSVKELIN